MSSGFEFKDMSMTTAEKVYTMLGNENLWQAATYCHQVLADAEIPHSVCGGVAVCLHGYQRNTTDVDFNGMARTRSFVPLAVSQFSF